MLTNVKRLDQILVPEGDILGDKYTIDDNALDNMAKEVQDGSFDIFRIHKVALYQWIADNYRAVCERYGLSQNGVDKAGRNVIKAVLDAFSNLTDATNVEYLNNRQELLNETSTAQEFVIEIAKQQKKMFTDGSVYYLQRNEFIMTEDEARNQCIRADKLFSEPQNDIVQQILADFNYSFFTGKTMAMPETMLNLTLEKTIQNDMTGGIGISNVSMGNLSIAQLIKAYIEKRYDEGERRFEIIDLGKGNGGTVAAIYKGIKAAVAAIKTKKGNTEITKGDKISISIKGVERCHDFYTYLHDKFLPVLMDKAKEEIGDFVTLNVNVTEGDAREYVRRSRFRGDHTVVFTTNYVFHRFPNGKKDEILDIIARRTANMSHSAVFCSDMTRNISDLNRQYFDFGLNGPLNSGNDQPYMLGLFSRMGYEAIPFARAYNEQNPRFRIMDVNGREKTGMDEQFLQACKNSVYRRHQGFTIAAYRHI